MALVRPESPSPGCIRVVGPEHPDPNAIESRARRANGNTFAPMLSGQHRVVHMREDPQHRWVQTQT